MLHVKVQECKDQLLKYGTCRVYYHKLKAQYDYTEPKNKM